MATRETAATSAQLARGMGLAQLFLGIVGPPAVWALRIGAAYILVPYACWSEQRWLVHLPSVIAILAVAAITFHAWRLWRRAGGPASTELDGVLARSRFMTLFGMMNGAFWILVMAAEELASLFIDPCLTAGHPLRWLGN